MTKTALRAGSAEAPPLGELPWGAHVCQFYRGRQELLDTLIPYFRFGLAHGQQCLWIAAEPLRASEAREALRQAVPDLDIYERKGQIEILDHQDWYLREGNLSQGALMQRWLDREAEALRRGFSGLRLTGNTSFVEPKDWDDFISYEACVHQRFLDRRIVALCTYSLQRCDPDAILDVVRHHDITLARNAGTWGSMQCASVTLAHLADGTDSGATTPHVARRLAEQLTRLQTITTALSEASDHASIVQVMDHDIRASLGADSCTVALLDPDTSELRLLGDTFDAEAPLAEALRAGTVSFLSTQSAIAARFPALGESSYRALALLPICASGRRLGAVAFGYHDERAFPSNERALFDDITRQLAIALDRARLYEEANEARRRAEQSDRAKDEFLAMLGHELRNPLSPIATALELLHLRGVRGGEKELTVIKRQVRHLVSLVDDLLDVSRITRGMVELSRERIEISEIVARAVEIASPLLEQRAHHLALVVPREGLVAFGDARRLAQVVSNLLTNAAKYTEPGGRIAVTASREGAELVLCIRDSGIGITKEMLPQVFDLFTQERQALDRSQGGLGLGLAIVRSMVALHGGTVTAHSDGKGKGSEFTVRLPADGAAAPLSFAPPVKPVDMKQLDSLLMSLVGAPTARSGDDA